MSDIGPVLDPRAEAGIELICRIAGARAVDICYDDSDSDVHPRIWSAVVTYEHDDPRFDSCFEVASGFTPETAILRLCELLFNGGFCPHCDRPTGIADEIETMPLDMVCWLQFDPELQSYLPGCVRAGECRR